MYMIIIYPTPFNAKEKLEQEGVLLLLPVKFIKKICFLNICEFNINCFETIIVFFLVLVIKLDVFHI